MRNLKVYLGLVIIITVIGWQAPGTIYAAETIDGRATVSSVADADKVPIHSVSAGTGRATTFSTIWTWITTKLSTAALTIATISAGAAGFSVDADGDVTGKSFTTPQSAVNPDSQLLRGPGTNGRGVYVYGPATEPSASYGLQYTTTGPAVNNLVYLKDSTGTKFTVAYTSALPDGTTATTQTVGDSTTKVSTTAFVATGLALKAALAGNNTFTGDHNFVGGTMEVPHGAGSASLATTGGIRISSDHKQLSANVGGTEMGLPFVQHAAFSFDPLSVYGNTLHRMPMLVIGDDAPHGITILKWAFTFDANPTAEIDADIMWADAFIGVANAAVIDQLDTTDGASSESTAGNINSGAVIANGKVIYLEIDTSYTEAGHTCLLDIWYQIEED